ncbi:MAG: protein kinase [bacterium]|nr:protein kinase [bacterium]
MSVPGQRREREGEALDPTCEDVCSATVSDTGDASDSALTGSAAPDDLPVVDANRYLIAREQARGGLGRILAAHDRRLGRDVAIKELLHDSGAASRRFAREAQLTARLQHPAIVPVYEAGRWPAGKMFYSMKMVTGSSLKELIAARPTLDERLALLPSLTAVTEAIAYAHSQRIIHRDLKPSNVMVGEFGETVVIDWGLAKDLSEPTSRDDELTAGPYRSNDSDHTAAGTVLGTPSFMAPEQARGEEVDARADVYALGAMLYQLLAGRPAYVGDSPADVLRQVLAGLPKPIDVVEPGVPRDLAAIVAKAMTRKRADRYESAKSLAEELRRFQTGQLVGAHRYSRGELARRWLRRNRAPVVVATILVTILVLAVVVSVRRIVVERDTARRERALAEQRAFALTLTQAKTSLETDPTATIAWLKRYPGDGPEIATATKIAADAVSRGVARAIMHTASNATAMAVSPGGSTIVTGGDDKALQLFDVASATPRATLPFTAQPYHVAWAPDGGRFAAGGGNGALAVWSAADLSRKELVGHRAPIVEIRFSPDGRSLLTLDETSTAWTWDLIGGTTRHLSFAKLPPTSYAIWLHDGTPLQLVARGRTVEVWNVQTGARRRVLAHDGVVDDVVAALAADVAITWTDRRLYAWNVATGALVASTATRGRPVGVRVSADGKHIAHWYDDRTIAVWDIGDERVRSMQLRERLFTVAFSADGALLAAGSNGGIVTLWDLDADAAQTLVGHRDLITRLDFVSTRGGTILLSAGDSDRTIREWPVVRGTRRVLRGHPDLVDHVSVSSDGQHIATASSDGVRVWSVVGGEDSAFAEGTSPTQETAFSPDSRRLAWARWDGAAHWVDLASGRGGLLQHGEPVQHVEWLAGGAELATATEPGTVSVWSIANGRQIVLGHHDGEVTMLERSPDGERLLSSGVDGTVRLWNLATHQMRIVGRHSGAVDRAYFLPDGRFVVSASHDGTLRLWDLTTGASRVERRPGAEWLSLAVSPVGGWVAAGARDGTLALWQPTLSAPPRYWHGHDAVARNVAFAPDGSLLASVSFDRTVRLWKPASGDLAQLRGHEGAVISLAFTPDGKQLATASGDATTRVWSVDAAHFLSPAHLSSALNEISSVVVEERVARDP